MSDLLAAGHIGPLIVIALATVALVMAARRRTGAWLKVFAVVLVVDEVSWWVFMAAGGGEPDQRAQPLPFQLCDMAIFVAAAALWTRRPLLVEVTYFWALAGTIQALLTPALPQPFPTYPYFQYYIAHGGVVAAALVLVVGLRLYPRRWAVAWVAGITIAYAAFVGLVDAVTGADYMFLRAKPAGPTLLDVLGPWPWYIPSAIALGVVLFAVLDAPFWPRRLRERPAEALG
ncbi:MAG TPA: TIGR02206 family membrane protein [Candidatus Dormibacteraeota bacterium]|nr:TIGR02206 family membrane protein [Candidatus Dormibacteraeota bacterium]